MPQDFARDLGYLAKFLQALQMHADSLEAPAGDRLKSLLGEQEAAWAEIRALLAGDPRAAAGAADAPAAAAPETTLLPVPAAPPAAAMRRLTVGSLLS